MNALRQNYQQTVAPALATELAIENSFAVPKINKIIVNVGVTEPQDARARKPVIESVVSQMKLVTGQQPQVTLAKQSIANFKLREGDPVGVKVTLRGKQMWIFLEKLINIALPRVKDFRGVSRTAFDGQGNYSLGLEEQLVFPELDYDSIDRVRSLQVTIVTSATSNDAARLLLEKLGMPFEKETE